MAENAIRIEGVIPTSPTGTQVVSGTVTSIPSGTQAISGTVTSVPSGTQAISGMVTTMPTVPAGTNFYTIAFSAIAGQTGTPYNFLSLFNPVGSGKTITVQASLIIPWATAAATSTNSMETFRTTAASGGTLTSAANIGKFSTASPNPIAEARTANPTITVVGGTLGGIPPAITSAGSGLSGIGNIGIPQGSSFTLLAGEGVCMRQVVAGDVDQLWNLGYIWTEL